MGKRAIIGVIRMLWASLFAHRRRAMRLRRHYITITQLSAFSLIDSAANQFYIGEYFMVVLATGRVESSLSHYSENSDGLQPHSYLSFVVADLSDLVADGRR